MSSSIQPTNAEQKMHLILADLWDRCREIVWWVDQVDRTKLSSDDLEELGHIDRITVGYGVLIQNVEALQEQYPTPAQFRGLEGLIRSHCYRSEVALRYTVESQQGKKRSRVQVSL